MESEFCGLIGVGLCMKLETQLTHKLGWFEHFNHPDTALSSFLATLCLYVGFFLLFYFLLFINYNAFVRD